MLFGVLGPLAVWTAGRSQTGAIKVTAEVCHNGPVVAGEASVRPFVRHPGLLHLPALADQDVIDPLPIGRSAECVLGPALRRWYGVPPAFHDTATRHFRAARSYVPRPYHGNAWLFRSEDERFVHDLGWGRLVRGRLEIALIPGTHSDVLKEPNLRETARQLSTILDGVAASEA